MKSRAHIVSTAILTIVLFGVPSPGAAQTVRINLGTVAPAGSRWHQILQKMEQEWSKVSGGKVDLHTYAGGTQGGELEMLDKVKIGRLQAVGLSGVGLAHVTPGVAALQIPMLVDSYAQLDRVRAGLEPRLETQIANSGYIVLNWSDVGWVHFFTKNMVRTPTDLKAARLFISSGDPEGERLYKDLGFNPIPLAVTDLLQSLKSGLIDAFDVPPLFALGDQSFAATKYMIDMKWAPIIGATIVDRKTWERIPADLRPQLLKISRAAGEEMRVTIRSSGDEAVVEMQKRGLTVVKLNPAELNQWRALAESARPRLKDAAKIPADLFDEAVRLGKLPGK